MKKTTLSALALIAALATTAAHAQTTPGWYIDAGAGASFGVNPTVHNITGKHDLKDDAANLSLLGGGGYAWSNGLRLEGEFFHNQDNIDGAKNFANASGHVTNNALFANALYDFNTGTRYTPYVGVGAGPDFVNVKSVGAPGLGYLKGDTLVGAYQGIVGVSSQLDANWAVTADYRYVASFDPKVGSTAGGQGRLDNASHNFVVGLRYSFDTPAAMPMHTATAPVVSPHAAGKPAVAPVPANFTVFFDFNKSVLTPEAKRIIAAAAKEYKQGGFAKIAITGHTDTVGKDGYNQKLSDLRAKAVEAELKTLGVDTKHISETGVGKNGLLVPTADGVREAQNRRAEIVLAK